MPATLFGERELSLPNVATVPQYSPFRYPGGKSRWYNLVKAWTRAHQPEVFIEPFAGGAHAGLAVAIEELAGRVVLVELDDNVAAVWRVIVEEPEGAAWLCEQIMGLDLSHESADTLLERKDNSPRDRALAMIVSNRISRGGVTAPGAGRLNSGENGKGLQSRWYPETLAERIQQIAEARERIEFVHGDGMGVARRYRREPGAAFFIDPPYPEAGGRLYEHSDVDHEAIFDLSETATGTVLLTYDDSDQVENLVARHEDLEHEHLRVSSAHHRFKGEFLIGQNLNWLDGL